MAIHQKHIESELQVLKEAVASAVHELSQPLNVVNLLADNVLDDVASLQEAGAADSEVLDGLKRRIESIVEQSAKASDITRWIRAFAVGIGADATDFDPDTVIERVVGIFANDLRVAGVSLAAARAPGSRWAVGDEALFAFALTETILWLGRVLPQPAAAAMEDPGRRIRIQSDEDRPSQTIVVSVIGDLGVGPVASAGARSDRTPPGDIGGDKLPPALPLLGLAGQSPGCSVSLSEAKGGFRIRLCLPVSALQGDESQAVLR